MSLLEDIQSMQAGMAGKIPDEIMAMFARATQELVTSQLAERAIQAGDVAHDFELPEIGGGSVSLSERLKAGPVVLNFYRGGWCPYCNLELHALQQHADAIQSRHTSLLAISPELPDKGAQTQANHQLSFPVLSDVGNHVARSYGLVFSLAKDLRPVYADFGFDIPATNGDDSFDLPIPATYVIRKDGTVAHAFVNADYTKRMEPEEIVNILGELKS